MNENVVARGSRNAKPVPFKKILVIAAAIAAIFMILGMISSISEAGTAVKNHKHYKSCYKYSYRNDYAADSKAGELKDYKMDCVYAQGAFGLGMQRYFEGGIILPLLIIAGGVTAAFVLRARSKSYELVVTDEAVRVTYSDDKVVDIPLCSIFTLEKLGDRDLNIVTSENAYTLRDMEGRDQVYAAIESLMPTITLKGPANNEQVLAKGYPPAIKPLLLILMIFIGALSLIAALAAEEFAILLIGVVPFVIVLVFYLLAKTPYFAVTDKRVFYVSDFGRKLSLPLNQITVTVTHQWFRQLHIGAPTGRIHLFWVRNTAELYDIINALLNEKQ